MEPDPQPGVSESSSLCPVGRLDLASGSCWRGCPSTGCHGGRGSGISVSPRPPKALARAGLLFLHSETRPNCPFRFGELDFRSAVPADRRIRVDHCAALRARPIHRKEEGFPTLKALVPLPLNMKAFRAPPAALGGSPPFDTFASACRALLFSRLRVRFRHLSQSASRRPIS